MKTATVYVLCFPNGKLYVGRTVKTVEKRFQQHSGSSKPVGKAIRKYGAVRVCLVRLHRGLSWSEAGELEQFWITQLGTMNPGGYNLTGGGEGSLGLRHTAESRHRMSCSHLGKPLAPEHRRRVLAGRTKAVEAAAAICRGRPLSSEHRAKLSEARRGKPKSPEHRARLSAAHRKRLVQDLPDTGKVDL